MKPIERDEMNARLSLSLPRGEASTKNARERERSGFEEKRGKKKRRKKFPEEDEGEIITSFLSSLSFLFSSNKNQKKATMQRSLSLRVNAAAKKAAPSKKAAGSKTAPKSAGAAKPSLAKYYGEGRARGGRDRI